MLSHRTGRAHARVDRQLIAGVDSVTVVIGVRSYELHLPGAHSLKDKRSVLKSLKDRLHNEFNVSVAETGHHDAWQTAELTICLVSAERRHAASVLESVDRFVESNPLCRIVDTATSFL